MSWESHFFNMFWEGSFYVFWEGSLYNVFWEGSFFNVFWEGSFFNVFWEDRFFDNVLRRLAPLMSVNCYCGQWSCYWVQKREWYAQTELLDSVAVSNRFSTQNVTEVHACQKVRISPYHQRLKHCKSTDKSRTHLPSTLPLTGHNTCLRPLLLQGTFSSQNKCTGELGWVGGGVGVEWGRDTEGGNMCLR